MRGFIGTTVGLAAVVGTLSLAGCVVVVGNESKVDYAQTGDSPRWRLGVTVDQADKATASQLGLNRDRTCLIESVVSDSPADRAGLKRYDIITRVNGSDEAGVNDVLEAIRCTKPAGELRLTVIRGGQPVEVTAILRE